MYDISGNKMAPADAGVFLLLIPESAVDNPHVICQAFIDAEDSGELINSVKIWNVLHLDYQ